MCFALNQVGVKQLSLTSYLAMTSQLLLKCVVFHSNIYTTSRIVIIVWVPAVLLIFNSRFTPWCCYHLIRWAQPSRAGRKTFDPLKERKKEKLPWDKQHVSALWSSRLRRLLVAEAQIGNTICINVQPSLSPANVSLLPRRRHNFAAYMGPCTTSVLS